MADDLNFETVITGAEFLDFYLNHWPGNDWFLDDVGFEFEDEDGNIILKPDAKIRLGDCGFICWHGKDGAPHRSGEMFPFIEFFEKLKPDATVFLVAKVPAEKVAEARAFLETIGATITVGSQAKVAEPAPLPKGA